MLFGELEGVVGTKSSPSFTREELDDLLQRFHSVADVGSPEVAMHVASWSASPDQGKIDALTALGRQLASGATTVLLREVRRPRHRPLSPPSAIFKSPPNAFIVVREPGTTQDVIVDPFFTDAFRISPSPPAYTALLNSLPAAFVGIPAALRQLSGLLTHQMLRAYAEMGLVPPPWRRQDSMLARWLSANHADTPLAGATPSALGAAKAAAGALPSAAGVLPAGGVFSMLPALRVIHGFEVTPKFEEVNSDDMF